MCLQKSNSTYNFRSQLILWGTCGFTILSEANRLSCGKVFKKKGNKEVSFLERLKDMELKTFPELMFEINVLCLGFNYIK